jgi:hypothetical protein
MFLQQLFSSTAASKGANSELKRQAAVGIGCIMMKVYFQCNTINNCKNVIQTIDAVLKNLDTAPAAHRVTFRWVGGPPFGGGGAGRLTGAKGGICSERFAVRAHARTHTHTHTHTHVRVQVLHGAVGRLRRGLCKG